MRGPDHIGIVDAGEQASQGSFAKVRLTGGRETARQGRRHHELVAWQEAIALVTDVYRLTVTFPREEVYALTSQLRRAAVSVPSNIAEGAARGTDKEFLQFLIIARGSLSEVETQLIIATELAYMKSDDPVIIQVDEVFALLGGLMKSIKAKMR